MVLPAIQPMAPIAPPEFIAPATEATGVGFGEAVGRAIGRVDDLQHGGDAALVALASGGDVDLHGAMIALEEAEISLRAMVAVRDKAIGAYEQIMNLAI